MVPEPHAAVRLHGHPGLLRHLAPGVAPLPPTASGDLPAGIDDGVDRWVWEGSVDGPGLASLVRTVLLHGAVPCEVDGRPHRARAVGCWYDAGHGTVVVELAGLPHPLA